MKIHFKHWWNIGPRYFYLDVLSFDKGPKFFSFCLLNFEIEIRWDE